MLVRERQLKKASVAVAVDPNPIADCLLRSRTVMASNRARHRKGKRLTAQGNKRKRTQQADGRFGIGGDLTEITQANSDDLTAASEIDITAVSRSQSDPNKTTAIALWSGDMTKLHIDAVVNAANER
jgi:hypothetical protein